VARVIATLRALIFYAGYAVITVVWGVLSVLVAWLLPYRARFAFIVGCWTRASLWWLKITCGVTCELSGLANIPRTPCIVMCRHESAWETLFLQTLFAPQATLIKRELLWIPFWGWAYWLVRPIAINRATPRKALRQLIDAGSRRLAEGIWVTLFPEGTRMPPGQAGKFQPGGAVLAGATGAPILVVAHNAGSYWPAHSFRKRPGTIKFTVAPLIETANKTSKEINADAAAVMAELTASLS
jgi:1-acyl-sn-glycerol-3-phosphate acyltransferase